MISNLKNAENFQDYLEFNKMLRNFMNDQKYKNDDQIWDSLNRINLHIPHILHVPHQPH